MVITLSYFMFFDLLYFLYILKSLTVKLVLHVTDVSK